MSLDLIKNALFQAVTNGTTGIPGLTFYPEAVDFQNEVYPNLSFLEIDTEHEDIPSQLERVSIPTGLNPPNPAFTILPVIARKRSRLHIMLRDSLGSGQHDGSAYAKVRNTYNAVDRFFSTLRLLQAGATGQQTIAEFYYRSAKQQWDPSIGLFQGTFEIDVDPWRLLDTAANGISAGRADSIEIDVVNQPNGAVWIVRLYPNPTW